MRPRTSPAFPPLIEERLEYAALGPRSRSAQGAGPQRLTRAPQEAGLLESGAAVGWACSGLDPLEPGDGLIAVEDEDGGARAHLPEVAAEAVLQLGYGGLFH